jgi:hypothetical protein
MTTYPHAHFDFRAALGAENPAAALGAAVSAEVYDYGADRAYLMRALDQELRALRAIGDLPAADAVTDVMERLDGWCAPNARL